MRRRKEVVECDLGAGWAFSTAKEGLPTACLAVEVSDCLSSIAKIG